VNEQDKYKNLGEIMDTAKARTKQESHTIIAGMAGGYAVGHAVAFVAPVTGTVVGLSSAAVFFFFLRFREGLELSALVRGLGGVLLGLMVGGTMLYKMPMVDGGLVMFSLVISLFFFWRVKKGGAK
jgi:hypothetical protein